MPRYPDGGTSHGRHGLLEGGASHGLPVGELCHGTLMEVLVMVSLMDDLVLDEGPNHVLCCCLERGHNHDPQDGGPEGLFVVVAAVCLH